MVGMKWDFEFVARLITS